MQRLSDLIPNFELHAVCCHCQRMIKVDVDQLQARFGPDCALSDVRTRLRCHRCHRRSADMRVVYVGTRGQSRGFHYRQ